MSSRRKKKEAETENELEREMSSVREKYGEEVEAILLADIHLQLNPPIWRTAEPDWFAAMARPLEEIKNLKMYYNCPVLCAGDVFEKWNSSPELINFADEYLPHMYAIPGQHDLPLHNYGDLKKSAYYTLVNTGRIQNVLPGVSVAAKNIWVHGFPYGCELGPRRINDDDQPNVALVHKYIWMKGYGHPEASPKDKIKPGTYKGGTTNQFDVIVYGDNHKHFQTKISKSLIWNCGTILRRHLDEEDYKPCVGLLMPDGRIETYELDTSQDKYIDVEDVCEDAAFDMKEFIKELEELGDVGLDFVEALMRYLKKKTVSPEAKTLMLEILEQVGE
jgi:DNA repair exonuclease SbcCD nuclease subunit